MQTCDIDIKDGKGLITVAIRHDQYQRLLTYLRDFNHVLDERDTALEELAALKKMIKELP